MEQTDNGMDFSMTITGPQGARFTLHPVMGRHTKADVTKAENYLYAQHDVVGRVKVEWFKPGMSTDRYCTVCENWKTERDTTCDHIKNGYCLLFRRQAEADAITYGMKPPRNQEEKT